MTLSSVSTATSTIGNRNTFVPTRSINTLQAGSTTNVGRGGDTYYCASCGGQKVVSSFYCPTCSGGSSARTSTAASGTSHANGYCPMCNKATTYSASTPAGATYFHSPRSGVR